MSTSLLVVMRATGAAAGEPQDSERRKELAERAMALLEQLVIKEERDAYEALVILGGAIAVLYKAAPVQEARDHISVALTALLVELYAVPAHTSEKP